MAETETINDAVAPDVESAPKAFATSKKARDDEPVTFTLDERTYTAHRPKQSVFVALAAAAGNTVEQIKVVPRFIDASLEPADRAHIAARLRDPDDDLDIDDLVPIFNYLMEEFTGRPTGSQSD